MNYNHCKLCMVNDGSHPSFPERKELSLQTFPMKLLGVIILGSCFFCNQVYSPSHVLLAKAEPYTMNLFAVVLYLSIVNFSGIEWPKHH